jgi:hypothetical protein
MALFSHTDHRRTLRVRTRKRRRYSAVCHLGSFFLVRVGAFKYGQCSLLIPLVDEKPDARRNIQIGLQAAATVPRNDGGNAVRIEDSASHFRLNFIRIAK